MIQQTVARFRRNVSVIPMDDNDDKQFKPIDSAFVKEIRSDLESNMQKFRDPIILGELVYRLMEERENTNRLLKNILQRLEAIETGAISSNPLSPTSMEDLLPQIDEQIVDFIKETRKATAEEVRSRFNYKGKNAASARLNRLCDMGVLQKKQVEGRCISSRYENESKPKDRRIRLKPENSVPFILMARLRTGHSRLSHIILIRFYLPDLQVRQSWATTACYPPTERNG